MRVVFSGDEWYPVYELWDAEADDVRAENVPDGLAERYRIAYAAFKAVREELDDWLRAQ